MNWWWLPRGGGPSQNMLGKLGFAQGGWTKYSLNGGLMVISHGRKVTLNKQKLKTYYLLQKHQWNIWCLSNFFNEASSKNMISIWHWFRHLETNNMPTTLTTFLLVGKKQLVFTLLLVDVQKMRPNGAWYNLGCETHVKSVPRKGVTTRIAWNIYWARVTCIPR